MAALALLAALSAPAGFLVAAAVAVRHPGLDPGPARRTASAAGWLGIAAAALAAAVVAVAGDVQSATLGWDGLGLSVRLDALSVVMLVMVALLAAVVVRYSDRYLEGDERHGRFLGRLALTIAAVELLVLAGNLVVLLLAWVATSLALHQLLVFYGDRRGARVAARKKFVVARIGDVMLASGAALLFVEFGTGDLGEIFAGLRSADADGARVAAAALLAGAAILKSAQFPTHGWLIEVMETPTPVSALLHAGILNAGPFLMIRMAFVIDGMVLANSLLIVAGGLTAVVASVALLTQPSVKVALGYSSAAHMGFMLLVCGLGVYAAALLHLVAHSFYKAHAFLASGSVVDEARTAGVRLPARLGSPARVLAGLAVAVGLYLPLALVLSQELADPALLVIGAILVLGTTQLMAPAVDSDGPFSGVVRAGVLALGVTTAFFVLEAGTHALLYDAVPHAEERGVVPVVLATAVLVAFAVVVALQIFEPARAASPARRRWAVHLRNGLYANAALDRLVGAWTLPAGSRRT